MKRLHLFFFAITALSGSVLAQDKFLSLDDIFSPDPKVRVRLGGTPVFVQWAKDGRSFRQIVGGRLMRVDAVSGEAKPYYDDGALVAALMRMGIKQPDATAMANAGDLNFDPNDKGILIEHQMDLWYYDLSTRQTRRLTNSPEKAEKEADFSPDGRWVSFVRGNDLLVAEVANGREKQLTRDGREGDDAIYNGYLDWIYEEELYGRGQKRGYWWSPDSKNIAFLRLDESPVPKFLIPNDIVDDQAVETTFYPQAGDPNPIVRLGIVDVSKNSTIPNPARRIPGVGNRLPAAIVPLGDPAKFVDLAAYTPDDLLIARVTWSPDSRNVLFQALNREQTSLDLNAANLEGKVRKVLTETTPAWVEVYDNPIFAENMAGNAQFVWQSARNGWRHLYLYDTSGQMVRQLTTGKWEVRNLYGVDKANGWVYFAATKDSHIEENIYRVKVSGGEVERISKGNGWHAANFNDSFTHFVGTWSDVSTPPQVRLFTADGSLVRAINENKVDVLGTYRLSRPEFITVKTRDGFEMEAMMIKPPDFDPSKKYPVLTYTYAGPHAPSVFNRWGGNRGMWFQHLAQKGFVVWVCDNRAASGKGEESVWPSYKNFMVLELRDIEDGINYLKSQPFIDGSRIGMFGWSFGGMMTGYALTHSKSFKMGIAGGMVSDWRLYDSIYTERYMGLPKNNVEGYNRTSVLQAAEDLHGKLLLIHGGIDDNVHSQNTIKFAYELQKADKQFEMMLYPTQRHGITDPHQVKHWYTLMTEFIERNL